jgi:hypothetical protein
MIAAGGVSRIRRIGPTDERMKSTIVLSLEAAHVVSFSFEGELDMRALSRRQAGSSREQGTYGLHLLVESLLRRLVVATLATSVAGPHTSPKPPVPTHSRAT